MKKSNKGFSLVELIVVVLIMAIIAVALAPQVMKWVENARIASDMRNYEQLQSALQLALATEVVHLEVISSTEEYGLYIETTGAKLKKGSTVLDSSSGSELYKALNLTDPEWQQLKKKASGDTPDHYEILIDNTTGAPKISEALTPQLSSDLR